MGNGRARVLPKSLNSEATGLNQKAPQHGAQSGCGQESCCMLPTPGTRSSRRNLVEPATDRATVCSLKEQSYAE